MRLASQAHYDLAVFHGKLLVHSCSSEGLTSIFMHAVIVGLMILYISSIFYSFFVSSFVTTLHKILASKRDI